MPHHRTGTRPRYDTLDDHLWNAVTFGAPDECWPYIGPRTRRGYGQFSRGPRRRRTRWLAHRAAYFACHGVLPAVVLHTCDYPSCCNPLHLFGGTQADNLADMWAKGRGWSPFAHGYRRG